MCIRGTFGAEVLDFARELPGEKVFEKYTLYGCQNTQLIDYNLLEQILT